MSWLLPLALTAAAASLTYLFCVRPMVRGRRRQTTSPELDTGVAGGDGHAFDAQVRRLRAEIDRIREADASSQTNGATAV